MALVAIEPRPDGSLLLTRMGGARWGVAVLGFAVGGSVLATVASGGATLVGSVVALPLGVILLLAGLAAIRHRDWVLFDGQARQVASRRGLLSMFRSVETFPFDDVEAVVVDREGEGALAVRLRCAGGVLWLVDGSGDPGYITRLAAAIHRAGGWPVLGDGRQAATSSITGAAGPG